MKKLFASAAFTFFVAFSANANAAGIVTALPQDRVMQVAVDYGRVLSPKEMLLPEEISGEERQIALKSMKMFREAGEDECGQLPPFEKVVWMRSPVIPACLQLRLDSTGKTVIRNEDPRWFTFDWFQAYFTWNEFQQQEAERWDTPAGQRLLREVKVTDAIMWGIRR